ncbi:MAG TPA: triose-phosphate isomerase [Spirochaetota bacterium]|nr:triose-phosphate isomerase [Spirochaetota bacterium]
MNKNLIAGNWKMNNNIDEAVSLANDLIKADIPSDRDVMIAPTFPCLQPVNDIIKDSQIKLGAQNMHFEDKGAFTGEVSASMLKSAGVSYVILGHSERRNIFKESNEFINKKVKKALEEGFKTILCVGELLAEREKGIQNDVVKEQIIEGISGISEAQLDNFIIAYEPVWAIGTGKTATPEDADTMHAYIRNVIKDIYSENAAANLLILYGGSMKDSNVDSLLAKENINGGLVGGASLKPEQFTRIINYQ